MKSFRKELWFNVPSRRGFVNITRDVEAVAHHQADHPEQELVHSEEQEHLMQVIRKLPVERQQLLILKFVEHLSNAEIGQIMGRSEGAIKSLYHRTLLSIRDELSTSQGSLTWFVSNEGEMESDAKNRDGQRG